MPGPAHAGSAGPRASRRARSLQGLTRRARAARAPSAHRVAVRRARALPVDTEPAVPRIACPKCAGLCPCSGSAGTGTRLDARPATEPTPHTHAPRPAMLSVQPWAPPARRPEGWAPFLACQGLAVAARGPRTHGVPRRQQLQRGLVAQQRVAQLILVVAGAPPRLGLQRRGRRDRGGRARAAPRPRQQRAPARSHTRPCIQAPLQTLLTPQQGAMRCARRAGREQTREGLTAARAHAASGAVPAPHTGLRRLAQAAWRRRAAAQGPARCPGRARAGDAAGRPSAPGLARAGPGSLGAPRAAGVEG